MLLNFQWEKLLVAQKKTQHIESRNGLRIYNLLKNKTAKGINTSERFEHLSVLSYQSLQSCAILRNFVLPWAILTNIILSWSVMILSQPIICYLLCKLVMSSCLYRNRSLHQTSKSRMKSVSCYWPVSLDVFGKVCWIKNEKKTRMQQS